MLLSARSCKWTAKDIEAIHFLKPREELTISTFAGSSEFPLSRIARYQLSNSSCASLLSVTLFERWEYDHNIKEFKLHVKFFSNSSVISSLKKYKSFPLCINICEWIIVDAIMPLPAFRVLFSLNSIMAYIIWSQRQLACFWGHCWTHHSCNCPRIGTVMSTLADVLSARELLLNLALRIVG